MHVRTVSTRGLHGHDPTVLVGLLERVVQGRGLWHGSRTEKERITDHGFYNFVYPNHENKQVRYSFPFLNTLFNDLFSPVTLK